jgi:pyridoxine 5-phosphate synthase
MIQLAVNIDHIATLREARGGIEPDPVHAAVIAEAAGAAGIVCHLREDRRHVNDRDVRALRDVVTTKLDLEMAATEEIISIALDVVPDLVTIVPEKREELTTEGGLDVARNIGDYTTLVARMHDRGIQVSFFIEPLPAQIEAVTLCAADVVEFHTGTYANARSSAERHAELTRLRLAAELAGAAGLVVTAGHGLSRHNLAAVAGLPNLAEVSIGHALISHAALVGMERAVRDYLAILAMGRPSA